jgi:hypothetical protein
MALQIKANLENLTGLKPEGVDFRWYLKVCLIKQQQQKI